MRSRFLFFILALAGFLTLKSSFAVAMTLEQCLSSAEQVVDQKKGWQVMDSQCPIGNGLWDRAPKNENSQFWIQCGVTGSLPKAWFSNVLEKIVPKNKIVLRREEGRYRCLLGPFNSHAEVVRLKSDMRSNKHLQSTFIREITGNGAVNTSYAAKKPVSVIPKPLTQSSPNKVQPTLVVNKAVSQKDDKADAFAEAVFEREQQIKAEKAKALKRAGSPARQFIQIEDMYSPEPYVDDLHHIEEQRAWLRASLPEANEICRRNGMSLVALDKLRGIANSKVRRDKLPKRLPFWVKEQQAYDMAMMVPIRLTENSALYVLCEK